MVASISLGNKVSVLWLVGAWRDAAIAWLQSVVEHGLEQADLQITEVSVQVTGDKYTIGNLKRNGSLPRGSTILAICDFFCAPSPLGEDQWEELRQSFRLNRRNRLGKLCPTCRSYFEVPACHTDQIYCSAPCAWRDKNTLQPKSPLGQFIFQQMAQRGIEGYSKVDRYCGLSLQTTRQIIAFPRRKPLRRTLEKYASAFGNTVNHLEKLAGGTEDDRRHRQALENLKLIQQLMPAGSPAQRRKSRKAGATMRGVKRPDSKAPGSWWANPITRRDRIRKLIKSANSPHRRLTSAIVSFRRWQGHLPTAREQEEIARRWEPKLMGQGVTRTMITATLRQIVAGFSPHRRGRPPVWLHEQICLMLSQEPRPTFPEIAKAAAGEPDMAESLRRSHKHWHTRNDVPTCYIPKYQPPTGNKSPR